ncbi:MAG: hypothetical protein KDA52_18575, partial [Planctomycetaceae bacterium]|nr:hypothetical protein [Planctomycetaceae bacterium]
MSKRRAYEKLTWIDGRGYKKVYSGRQLYFRSKIRNPEAHAKALADIKRRIAEYDRELEGNKPHRAQYTTAINLREKLASACQQQLELLRARDNSLPDVEGSARLSSIDLLHEDVRDFVRLKLRIDLSDDSDEDHDDESNARIEELTGNLLEEYLDERDSVWLILAKRSRLPHSTVGAWRQDHPEEAFPFTDEEVAEATKVANENRFKNLRKRMNQEIKELRQWFDRNKPIPLNEPDSLHVNPLSGETDETIQEWCRNLDLLDTTRLLSSVAEHSDTIAGNIDEYLAAERRRMEAGEIKPSSFESREGRLKHFREFAGNQSVSAPLGKALQEFRAHQLEQIASGSCSQRQAKHLVDAAIAFVTWLHDVQIIGQLPPGLKKLKIKVSAAQIETLADEEVSALLSQAQGELRLYLLLMLNCGMTQLDIADTQQEDVDWKSGRIRRKRSKTAKHDNVPVVNHLLWDETFQLLREYRSDGTGRALTNRNGNPLRVRGQNASGKATNIDNISDRYTRFCDREDI